MCSFPSLHPWCQWLWNSLRYVVSLDMPIHVWFMLFALFSFKQKSKHINDKNHNNNNNLHRILLCYWLLSSLTIDHCVRTASTHLSLYFTMWYWSWGGKSAKSDPFCKKSPTPHHHLPHNPMPCTPLTMLAHHPAQYTDTPASRCLICAQIKKLFALLWCAPFTFVFGHCCGLSVCIIMCCHKLSSSWGNAFMIIIWSWKVITLYWHDDMMWQKNNVVIYFFSSSEQPPSPPQMLGQF